MFDAIQKFGTWYWNSGAAFFITMMIVAPIIADQVIKRLPQRRKKNAKAINRTRKLKRSR